MRRPRKFSVVREVSHRLWTILGAALLTLIFFIVLPLMQTISKPPTNALFLAEVDLAHAEPPPPPPPPSEEEPERKLETEDRLPELVEQAPPLDLSQLELALNPGFSEGWMAGGDFAINLNALMATTNTSSGGDGLDAIFSELDLDEKPRAVYQPGPVMNVQMRRRTPATVYILFLVDERGRVVEPRVQKSTDQIFEKPALSAVKQWQFEPGKRKGKAVRFRMRVPIIFPQG
jgi:protein TonB